MHNDKVLDLLHEKVILEGGQLTAIEEAVLEDKVNEFIEDSNELVQKIKVSKNKSIFKAKVTSLIGIGLGLIGMGISTTFPVYGIILAVSSLISAVISVGINIHAIISINKLIEIQKKADNLKDKATNKKDKEALDKIINNINIALMDTKDRGKESVKESYDMLSQVKFI